LRPLEVAARVCRTRLSAARPGGSLGGPV